MSGFGIMRITNRRYDLVQWKIDEGASRPNRKKDGEGDQGSEKHQVDGVDVWEASDDYVAQAWEQVLHKDEQKPVLGEAGKA